MNRLSFLKYLSSTLLTSAPLASLISSNDFYSDANSQLFTVKNFTEPGSFTSGAEGPAVDINGNLYAVNYLRQQTIGKISPDGEASVFLELENGSIANGIRFNSNGYMLLADYVNHNVLKVNMNTRDVSVYSHSEQMNQPNDIAIGRNDIVYASDPNWSDSEGQIWRIDQSGKATLLENNMGTTNGIEVSADEKKLYVNESVQRNIFQYDLSSDGEISNKRLLIQFSDFGMDGMRCDLDGNLYVTRHGKGTVAIISADGEIIRDIPLAEGKNATNLAFGGPDGCTVYVTVADVGNVQVFRTNRPGRSWKIYQEKNENK